eukprot:1698358-Pleurochrysis_carterae.AAC.1
MVAGPSCRAGPRAPMRPSRPRLARAGSACSRSTSRCPLCCPAWSPAAWRPRCQRPAPASTRCPGSSVLDRVAARVVGCLPPAALLPLPVGHRRAGTRSPGGP